MPHHRTFLRQRRTSHYQLSRPHVPAGDPEWRLCMRFRSIILNLRRRTKYHYSKPALLSRQTYAIKIDRGRVHIINPPLSLKVTEMWWLRAPGFRCPSRTFQETPGLSISSKSNEVISSKRQSSHLPSKTCLPMPPNTYNLEPIWFIVCP